MAAQSLDDADLADLLSPLRASDERLRSTYPGGVPVQPAHTCYVPADRLRPSEARRWGDEARALLAEHAPDAAGLAAALGRELPDGTWEDLLRLLAERPVHDLRVDLEDGYGRRPDDEEDAAVDRAVRLLAEDPPPAYGLRVKALEAGSAERSARTLDRWVTGLAAPACPPARSRCRRCRPRSRSRWPSPCWARSRRAPVSRAPRSSCRSRRRRPSSTPTAASPCRCCSRPAAVG
jgi:hypothetical protein